LNRWIEKIYYSSPVLVQNVAVSGYGFYLHRTRYGGGARQYFRELLESQRYSEAELRELQRGCLRNLVLHAVETVPYYRDLFSRNRLVPGDIRDLCDLGKIPILEKETVRSEAGRFLSDGVSGRILRLHTSGTTGSPLTILCDVESRRRHYAFLSRFRQWFGVSLGMPRATLCGRIVVSPGRENPPFWRYDASEKNYLFSSYHLSKKNLSHYSSALRRIEPEEICGYPSSVYAVGRHARDVNGGLPRPRLIVTTAETLLAFQRETIERAFSCPVTDQYGCTEMALFISQCEHGSYHVHPEYGIVEVLDERDRPVAPGEEGEVVCTGFVNRAMPLIRYRIGDRVVMGGESCRCGRSFPVIQKIEGRTDDILVTPDGRRIGRMDPIFKGLGEIVETQIVQTDRDTLTFRIVKGEGFREAHENTLHEEIRKRVGREMKILFQYVPEIERDRNGKFRSVVSLLKGSG